MTNQSTGIGDMIETRQIARLVRLATEHGWSDFQLEADCRQTMDCPVSHLSMGAADRYLADLTARFGKLETVREITTRTGHLRIADTHARTREAVAAWKEGRR